MIPGGPDPLDLLPEADPARLVGLAPLLVVAPHPDDETLGAGGLIARLRAAGARVDVLLVSDGAASHPGSGSHPPERLAALRRRELTAALAALGVDAERHLHALGCADGAVPGCDAAGFEAAVDRTRSLIRHLGPAAVLLPWRRDPHPDHRATSEIGRAALEALQPRPRVLEYPIWLRVRGAPEDWPQGPERAGFRLEIGQVLARKRAALDAHGSQTSPLIDDADLPYCLTPGVLALLVRDHEIFLEPS